MKTFLAILALAAAAFGAPDTSMQISSPDFPTGGTIPPRFTCEGSNTSPGLQFEYVPGNAKTLALIVEDPDAPRGTFTHWVLWNIPVETKEFSTGNTPGGVEIGQNDTGKSGYFGPCPPSGQHRYYFRLYALDGSLKLPAATRGAALQKALKGHVLAEATLLGRFGKGKASPTP